ncbi:universal stress protein UspE [Catenovulum maritimum]|uniref:Universal stress protein UspE n=1 Tax=Catenovulum maritimum TaxID=1513271 RepID=A0A0J8GUH2_9ALTE|nr:universal stress protein UspE [Catenovulum maritimum]KMT66425.1 universal stress protein UspE [Catenovulum maritimum]
MKAINKILVAIDPSTEAQKSLNRAAELASRTGASVTALLVIYDFSYEMTTMLSSDERNLMRQAVIAEQSTWLEKILEPYQASVNQIEAKVIWHNRPFEVMIKEILQTGYDLLVKSTHEHSVLRSVIFTPTDWHLIRKCPIPVLLVKDHDWPENGQIIAAINAINQESHHKDLNQNIIETAQFLSSHLNAETQLLTCYPGAPINLSIEIPEFDPQSYRLAIHQHHINALKKYAEEYEIDEKHCIVAEGLPEDEIGQVAQNLDAELIVMGTVGRNGISAALLGNTAEHLLDAVNCDVLAIKPHDFICPIKLD